MQTNSAEEILLERDEDEFNHQVRLFKKTLPKDENIFEKKSEKTASIYHEFIQNIHFIKL